MRQMDFYQLLSDVRLEDMFQAYFECRKNKRRSLSALRFELDYERHVMALWNDIQSRQYHVRSSNAFIVTKPVLREIFAADFRDRIVHHLVISKLMRLFEKAFSDYSFSCRAGKGTLYGVQHVNDMIRQCSDGYRTDCFVLRLDIQGFFFHIDKQKLYERLTDFLDRTYYASDKETILFLLQEILADKPQDHCLIWGHRSDWDDLPESKSLFHARPNCGLPIGNLTSQIFANFYLDGLDHYIESLDPNLFYGRYVDDLVLIHPDKAFLKETQHKIQQYLHQNLGLTLHPKKIVLQHYAKGFAFTGAFIKPGRIYPTKRFKASFYNKINEINRWWEKAVNPLDDRLIEKTLSSLNSYLGLLKHYQCWRMRLKAWNMLHPTVHNTFWINRDLTKVSVRDEIKEKRRILLRQKVLPPLVKKKKTIRKEYKNDIS